MSQSLSVDENVPVVQDIMRRAKAAGYNGIMFSEYHFLKLDAMDAAYFRNVQQVTATARELGLDIYPEVCTFGCSWGMLFHNPNLAEGTPIRDALFVAKGGQADIVQKVNLLNADFEQTKNGAFTGWDFQDNPGKVTFADSAVSHSGSTSLRMENISASRHDSRIMQKVKVSPFHLYHLSWWLKTDNFDAPGAINVEVVGAPGDRDLAYPSTLSPKRTQDWRYYDLDFNSFDNTEVNVCLGVWGGRGNGKIWWDDVKLENLGLMNVLRRDGCPLVVKSEDGVVYTEGKDFQPVVDPILAASTGSYDIYHTPPTIHLSAGSRIKEGQRLLVSYYSAFPITHHQEVNICFSHPQVYALVDDEIKRCETLLHPKGYIMGHDEIRTGDWCTLCQDRHLTPGQLLADNVSRCQSIIKKDSPNAAIFAWSDMFDPNHNARPGNYYLVNGSWEGSWEGLSKDVIIINWNQDKSDTLEWFGKRGNPQILAGYYDASPQDIQAWLSQAKNTPNIVGVMYTTWENNYRDLEAFAKAAWEGTEGGK